MVVSCWSVKGGSGVTVVAAALALMRSREDPNGTLAVDLAGDLPAAFGLPEPTGPGVARWAEARSDLPADALGRLETPVVGPLSLLHRGEGEELTTEAGALLSALVGVDDRTVVVDCGTLRPDREACSGATSVAAASEVSLLVTRPCYLALRRAVGAPVTPTGVVLVDEPGRALQRSDVESVLGVPVVAEVRVEPGVARAIDAGLLASRLPRPLSRSLQGAV